MDIKGCEMKKSLLSVFLITCCILFAGCSVSSESKETAPNLIKQETKELLIVTGEVKKTFKKDKAIKIARDAIQSAEKNTWNFKYVEK
jgi:thiamine biosynthesis lipoprotein ApbE